MVQTDSPLELLYSVPSLGYDESKGPPSFVFVTHQIVLDAVPFAFPEDAGFFIVNGWLGEEGPHQQNIAIRKPSGQLWVETGPRDLQLESVEVPYMAVTFFKGVEIPEEGIYSIEVWGDGELRLRYPFHIVVNPQVAS